MGARGRDGVGGGVASWWVREWLHRRAGRQGVEPVTLAIGVVPMCPPGPADSAAAVEDEFSVDSVADASFEGPHRFFAAVALGLLPQVVGPSGGVVADLGDGDHVDGVVELAVAAWVEPVPDHGSAGGFDGAV